MIDINKNTNKENMTHNWAFYCISAHRNLYISIFRRISIPIVNISQTHLNHFQIKLKKITNGSLFI